MLRKTILFLSSPRLYSCYARMSNFWGCFSPNAAIKSPHCAESIVNNDLGECKQNTSLPTKSMPFPFRPDGRNDIFHPAVAGWNHPKGIQPMMPVVDFRGISIFASLQNIPIFSASSKFNILGFSSIFKSPYPGEYRAVMRISLCFARW